MKRTRGALELDAPGELRGDDHQLVVVTVEDLAVPRPEGVRAAVGRDLDPVPGARERLGVDLGPPGLVRLVDDPAPVGRERDVLLLAPGGADGARRRAPVEGARVEVRAGLRLGEREGDGSAVGGDGGSRRVELRRLVPDRPARVRRADRDPGELERRPVDDVEELAPVARPDGAELGPLAAREAREGPSLERIGPEVAALAQYREGDLPVVGREAGGQEAAPLADGRGSPAGAVEPDQLPERVAEGLRDVGERPAAGDGGHREAAGLRHEDVVEHRDRGALDGRGGRVERDRVEPLPARVEEVPGRNVAAEEAAVHHPRHLAGREVEDSDPRLVHRRAEGGEDDLAVAGKGIGPPVPELSPRDVGGRQTLGSPAVGRDPEEPVGVARGEDDRAVPKPRGAAGAELLGEPERPPPLGGDLHQLPSRDEADPPAVGREEG